MRKTFTTADYDTKHGHFLILSTLGGDKYTEVSAHIVDGTDEAHAIAVRLKNAGSDLEVSESYWIHEGFIIVTSNESRDCAEALFVKNREEANEALSRFLADLNSY
jgi:hypothetical protein